MRNLFLLIFLLSITSCENDDSDYQSVNLTGDWVSEQKDTLTFVGSTLVYKSYIPYSTPLYFYSYQLKNDSILLHSALNSNLNERKSYYFKYSAKQIDLYKFNDIEKATYQRLSTK